MSRSPAGPSSRDGLDADRADDRVGGRVDGTDGVSPPPDEGFVLFREVQGFWRNQLLLVLAPAESLFSGIVLLAIGSQAPPRDQLILLCVWLGVGLTLPLLIVTLRLRTEVTPTMLRAGFVGFPKWRIPLERVESVRAVRVDPVRDLGGWGIRRTKRFGWVQNVAGEDAVVVGMIDGTKRTLGTHEPEELVNAVLAGAMGEPGRLIVPIGSGRLPDAPAPA